MQLKKKTQKGVLALLAVSAVGLLALALVGTGSTDNGSDAPNKSQTSPDSGIVTLDLSSSTVIDGELTWAEEEGLRYVEYDLSENDAVYSIDVNVASLPTSAEGVIVKICDDYIGYVYLNGGTYDDKIVLEENGVRYKGVNGESALYNFIKGKPQGAYPLADSEEGDFAKLDRVAGADRYETMTNLNKSGKGDSLDGTFEENDGNIVIASVEGFTDALVAAPLAGVLNTGIVTANGDALTDDAALMLENMDEHNVAYVVDGAQKVTSPVEDQLKAMGFAIEVLRDADQNVATVAVENQIRSLGGLSDTVIIASSTSFADAISIAPYAYNEKTPILLMDENGNLPKDVETLLSSNSAQYRSAIIVGGVNAVSASAQQKIAGFGLDITRLSGKDRYETNVEISQWLNSTSESNVFENKNVYVASGEVYADALAAAPIVGVNGGTVALVKDGETGAANAAINGGATPVVVGGTSAVSTDTEEEISNMTGV